MSFENSGEQYAQIINYSLIISTLSNRYHSVTHNCVIISGDGNETRKAKSKNKYPVWGK